MFGHRFKEDNVICYLLRSTPEQRDALNLSSVSSRPCPHTPRSVILCQQPPPPCSMYEHLESLVPSHSFERDFVSCPSTSPPPDHDLGFSSVQTSSAVASLSQTCICSWPTSSSPISSRPAHLVSVHPSPTAKPPLSPSNMTLRYLRYPAPSLTTHASTPHLQPQSRSHAIL